jgi:glutaredoxin
MPRGQRRSLIQVTIYSRPGCHLCDEMKAIVAHVARTMPIDLQEVDVSASAELEALYGLEIPVLMIDGKKTAKYRVTEAELRRALAGRAGPAG